jgi:hypothetical protein
MNRGWKSVAVLCLAWCVGLGTLGAANFLRWNAQSDQVDALVESWTVPQVLQRVAGASGWQIFVDPSITNSVRTRFHAKPPGEALQRLLSSYNYALVPNTNGPARLFVFRNSREQATQAIEPLKQTASTNLVANELIVTLKPGEKIEDLAKRLGAKIVGRSPGQNTYRLRFDDEKATQAARSELDEDPAVESIDNNYYVSRPDSMTPLGAGGGPIGLNPKAAPDGKYLVVGLIDAGVQPEAGGFSQFLLPGAKIETSSEKQMTHGTPMAATILQSLGANAADGSTTVRLLPIKVFEDGAAQTTTFNIAKGIFDAVEGGAHLLNLSLGADGLDAYRNSGFLQQTVENTAAQGIYMFAAAGNTPTTDPTVPAAYNGVIAVTATDRSGQLASYANRGDFVDVAAPGMSLVSFNGQQYYVQGTSTATAIVSGMAAAALERARSSGQKMTSDDLLKAIAAMRATIPNQTATGARR